MIKLFINENSFGQWSRHGFWKLFFNWSLVLPSLLLLTANSFTNFNSIYIYIYTWYLTKRKQIVICNFNGSMAWLPWLANQSGPMGQGLDKRFWAQRVGFDMMFYMIKLYLELKTLGRRPTRCCGFFCSWKMNLKKNIIIFWCSMFLIMLCT